MYFAYFGNVAAGERNISKFNPPMHGTQIGGEEGLNIWECSFCNKECSILLLYRKIAKYETFRF